MPSVKLFTIAVVQRLLQICPVRNLYTNRE
jgi:hypothetical protein